MVNNNLNIDPNLHCYSVRSKKPTQKEVVFTSKHAQSTALIRPIARSAEEIFKYNFHVALRNLQYAGFIKDESFVNELYNEVLGQNNENKLTAFINTFIAIHKVVFPPETPKNKSVFSHTTR